MEDQCSPLSWEFCYQEEGIKELRHSVLYTTLELETTILSAKEEINKKEFEMIHLRDLLSKTIKERDEAKAQCQKLLLDKHMLQQLLKQNQHQQQLQQYQQETGPLLGSPTSSEDESKVSDSKKHGSSSDSKKNIIASLGVNPIPQQPLPTPLPLQQSVPEAALKLATGRPLPEKGKLLLAVKEAGPLLQTLLLAGPLPQWQHPPRLDFIEIPPVTISSPRHRLIHQESLNSSSIVGKKRAVDF
ncbi:DUF1635 domain-containing protein [Cephalotus follicularis]|uniref:DUF1635 domain-containing protein n=1 Tax=Cephalotus follicularis TaxID=3775 RepID=A0A1Q3BI53_CEPFO|nr:DUF1635 domain-containing protein [Cephalotus follicularis]